MRFSIDTVAFDTIEPGQCRWPVDPVEPSPRMRCCGASVVDRFAPEGRREATHCRHHLDISRGSAWQGGRRRLSGPVEFEHEELVT